VDPWPWCDRTLDISAGSPLYEADGDDQALAWPGSNSGDRNLIRLLDRAVRKDFLQSTCKGKGKDDHLVISVHDVDNVFLKHGSAHRLIGHSHFRALESLKVVF
jgi:hypothetical protein